MNLRSLHVRLILWFAALTVAVSLAFGAYVYHGVKLRLQEEMRQTLTKRAQRISDTILAEVRDLPEIARRIDEVYAPASNSRFIRVRDEDNGILYQSGMPKDGAFDPAAIPIPNDMNAQSILLSSGVRLFLVSVATKVQGQNLTIDMAMPENDLEAALQGLKTVLLVGLPIMVLIGAIGAYYLVGRALKPVEEIRATAERITFGNLSNRLPVAPTGDAIEHLSLTLNQMIERLEDAYQQAARFSADASHELRTPLAIMRSELETILGRDDVSEPMRERIASILEETERMARIAESLLAISRLDAGDGTAEPKRVNLTDLVKSTAEQMLLLAEDKRISVLIEPSPAVWILGDRPRLKQVVVNLLDNAIKYSTEKGEITLEVYQAHGRACFSIQDTGMGISAESLPHVFDRFYRTDKARARGEGGAGLGLSIVRAICNAHGGTVEVQSGDQKGTHIRVYLPLAEAEVVA